MNQETTTAPPAEPTNTQVCDLEDVARTPEQFSENPFSVQAAMEAATEAKAAKKVSPLANIITGKKVRPVFVLIIGQPGIGKSTVAAQAPEPVFLDIERGLDQIGAARFPTPATFLEFMVQLDSLDKEEHPYKSIVVDTIDALEPLIVERTLKDLNITSIDAPKGGAGYIHAKMLWRKLLAKLKVMNERFNIILLGHVSVKEFNDPALPTPYNTWSMRLNEKCADVVKESCDTILYACLDITVDKAKITDKKGKGVGNDHVLRTKPAPGYPSKNRYDLSDPLPMEWAALQNEVTAFYNK